MADYTLTMNDDDFNVDAVDGNTKIVKNVPVLELAGEGDEFGNVFDAVGWPVTGGSLTEAGNKLTFDDVGGGGGSTYASRVYTYGDGDIACDWRDAKPAHQESPMANLYCELVVDDGNAYVWIQFGAFYTAGQHFAIAFKNINGASTELARTLDLGLQTTPKFRVRRRAADNTFWFYYDIGAGWVLLWTGVIHDAVHLTYADVMYPRIRNYKNAGATAYAPELERYYQDITDIAAQRFWDTSPTCDLVESGETYAFDAGAARAWALTGASDVETPDGGTLKFKVGWSDSGNKVDATWDVAWQTIAQVDVNAAAGNYDDHRYLHVLAQYNSDATQKPSITSFTISGSAESLPVGGQAMMMQMIP